MTRIGSLCSGYGGLDLGLMDVIDGTVAWHVENDKHPSAVLEARFPGVPNYGDLTAVDWSQVEPVDWLTAGYPCQPFSYAGNRKGSADERHLWPAVARAIGALRPGRVLLENVRGHVSLGLHAVLGDLAELGYDATWGVVRAADAGACHGRSRLFIVARDAQVCGRDRAQPQDERGEPSRPARGSGVVAPDPAERGWRGPKGEQRGLGAAERLAAAAADPADRSSESQRPRQEPCGRGEIAADADQQGRQGAEPARGHLVSTRSTAAATESGRWGARSRPGEAAPGQVQPGVGDSPSVRWGQYELAVRRWERILGRPAPQPTEQGRTGQRLNPRFVEWMQGLADGFVTDVLTRGPALKCLGNGVVPQQSALAVRTLTTLEVAA